MVRKVKRAVASKDEEFGSEPEEQLEEDDYSLPVAEDEWEDEEEGYELDQEDAAEPYKDISEDEY